jgi:hypothetical protein
MKTSQPSYNDLMAQNLTLRARVLELEATVRGKDATIEHLRKPKPTVLDPKATDRFKRPIRR